MSGTCPWPSRLVIIRKFYVITHIMRSRGDLNRLAAATSGSWRMDWVFVWSPQVRQETTKVMLSRNFIDQWRSFIFSWGVHCLAKTMISGQWQRSLTARLDTAPAVKQIWRTTFLFQPPANAHHDQMLPSSMFKPWAGHLALEIVAVCGTVPRIAASLPSLLTRLAETLGQSTLRSRRRSSHGDSCENEGQDELHVFYSMSSLLI